ncbi:MAG: WYL domain-containing protein [Clostridia bacterium]|nr:WYL domain-containing protein [Clostridia bacterium]
MNIENSRKIKLLKLWELLKRDTDEEHPMSTNEIIDKLGQDGIMVDRKILYTDIDLLIEYGYSVEKKRGRSNIYYVDDRSFNLPEIRILMDAVQSASFVTEKKTEELLSKIAELAGSKRGEMIKRNVTRFSTIKSKNESIYYSIMTIVDARAENKKIGFYYFDYDINRSKVFRKEKNDSTKDKWYVVNPVATILNRGQYYLLCYDDKHKSLTNYRVDRMDRVKVLEDQYITPNKEIEKMDLATYKLQQMKMYSGKVERVSFIADPSLIDVIFDEFGERVRVTKTEEGLLNCTVEVQLSPMFIAWACSFADKLKITFPQRVVKMTKEHLEKTLAQYV